MPAKFLTLSLSLLLITSCDRGSSLEQTILEAGGAAELRQACRKFYDSKQSWVMGNTNALPSVIAVLRPQAVTIVEGDVPLVDIQTSGGFNHRGVLVCVRAANHSFQPPSKWRLIKITHGVFEYRE